MRPILSRVIGSPSRFTGNPGVTGQKALLWLGACVLAVALSLGGSPAAAQESGEQPRPRQMEIPWEKETGCAGEGAVALALIKRTIFELPAFPHPSENYLTCNDVVMFPVAPHGRHALVQIRNTSFCRDDYCQTFIYSRVTKSFLLTIEAQRRFGMFHRQKMAHRNLEPFFEHKYIDLYNVVSLKVRGGYVDVVEGFDSLPMISFFPEK